MTTPASVQRIYLGLLLGNTLAASLIWGINTIFLLDAGLSNLEAFTANAFFTAGMVIFEVPTGIVADTIGRRASYLLGTVTLAVTTLLYVLLWQLEAQFWAWAIVSMLLGLGFTFFSGAVEAWLVDALTATGFEGSLESVFGKGQIVTGVAMLSGSVAGGYIAQATSLGVPFVLRGDHPRADVRARVRRHEGRRLHAEPAPGGRAGRAAYLQRVDRVRLESPGGEVDDAGVAVHGGRRHLRVLCPAAVPARALRRPGGVRDRRPRGGDRRGRADRRRYRGAVDQATLHAAHVGVAGRDGGERRDACVDRRVREPLRRDRPDRRLGAPLRGVDADPAGVPERPDPVAAARDDPLLRLDAGLDRRRRHPARAGSFGRRVGLPGLVPAGRGDLGARAAVRLAVAAAERAS